MNIPEEFLPVVKKALEVATATATMGESAKDALAWIDEHEDDDES